jgi:glycosyltransferase involved in cell wall biosynthesis
MRRRANGCILYSHAEANTLARVSPDEHVWVAPNSLYRRADIGVDQSLIRNRILYVGRLDPDKKPTLLLEAFALLAAKDSLVELCFVGEGSSVADLKSRASELRLADRVTFYGELSDPAELRPLYATARCSVSPGYCGLSLTQSLGFGVPMVVARDEPHAPEIELARLGFAVFFEANSHVSLAAALAHSSLDRTHEERQALVSYIRSHYSAEAMACGFIDALVGRPSAVVAARAEAVCT